jgi:uncharacterized protein
MPTPIKILINKITLRAELSNTPCAEKIGNILPLEARPNAWGDEFYFEIPVEFPLDETKTTQIKIGDIGYWPTGNALAIFFGPTPMSTGSDPVPASSVNLVGRIVDNATVLRKEKGALKIRIEKDNP